VFASYVRGARASGALALPGSFVYVARVHHDARQRIERVLRARGLLREPGDEPAQVKGADESLLPFLQAAAQRQLHVPIDDNYTYPS
jgi:hypothetical protein